MAGKAANRPYRADEYLISKLWIQATYCRNFLHFSDLAQPIGKSSCDGRRGRMRPFFRRQRRDGNSASAAVRGEKANVFSMDCGLQSDALKRREPVDEKARTTFIGTIAPLIAPPRFGRIISSWLSENFTSGKIRTLRYLSNQYYSMLAQKLLDRT